MNNVIKLPVKAPLFNPELRSKLESEISSAPDTNPAVIITTVENVLCSYLVSKTKEVASLIGSAIGKKIVAAISK